MADVQRHERLALVTTHDLLLELFARFDTVVFAGLRDEGKRVSELGTNFELKRYHGAYHTALGLLSRCEHLINRDFERTCRPSDET